MILADFGTTWCKFLDLAQPRSQPVIIAAKELAADMRVEIATGHNGQRFAGRYVNELIALARGGETMIDDDNYVLL
ncbi:MAG: ATPase, partial [Deltaproteobacteria bacterium]|nr:ATPase [Deltaproteobacteria bacterium]